MKSMVRIVAVLVAVACASDARADVVIETVPVGNPGNAPDTQHETPGYGGVDYVYNIGAFEITAGQYTEFLNAVAATDTYGLYNPLTDSHYLGCQITQHGSSGSYWYDFSGGTDEAPGSTAADWAGRPVNYVSWGDAARFANWLHNGQPNGPQNASTTEDGSYDLSETQAYYGPDGQTPDSGSDDWLALHSALLDVTRKEAATWVIPAEDEWYKAAYHKNDGVTGNYWYYPTSSDSRPGNQVADPDPGNNANFHHNAYTIGSPYWRTEIGEFENSGSPYGTFDQGGNLLEWNEAVLEGAFRGLRGGSFNAGGISMYAPYRYNANSPVKDSPFVGFRLSEVPEPATLFLLALGGLLVARRQR